MLENAIDLLQRSARSMGRILRVARTIADVAGSVDILGPHLAEVIGDRRGERAATHVGERTLAYCLKDHSDPNGTYLSTNPLMFVIPAKAGIYVLRLV